MQKRRLYKLTLKQESFCQAFTSNRGNATAAYRSAYNAQGMKAATIYVKSCNLLKKDKIRVRIEEIMQPHLQKYAISRVNMMDELLFTASCGRLKDNAQLVYKAIMRLMRVCLF